jgi:hypothetical protein
MLVCGDRHTPPSLVSLQIFEIDNDDCGVFCGLETGLPQKSGVATCWNYPFDFYKKFIDNCKCSTIHMLYMLYVCYTYVIYIICMLCYVCYVCMCVCYVCYVCYMYMLYMLHVIYTYYTLYIYLHISRFWRLVMGAVSARTS